MLAMLVVFNFSIYCKASDMELTKLKKNDFIVCYGDSITMAGQNNSYSMIAGKIINNAQAGMNIEVQRAFINGAPTSKLAEQLDVLVLEKYPKTNWLLIQDAGAAEPLEKFEKGLKDIIDKCVKNKINVILMTTGAIEPGFTQYKRPSKNAFEAHNQLRQKLADGKGVYLIDLESKWNKLVSETERIGTKLTADGCHPNEAGRVAIAAVFAQALNIKREGISFTSSGNFKEISDKQFNTIIDIIYDKK